ncbi:NADAR family protein [Flavobacterium sp. ALJ2]|uniref:NADAR family protein n=1 Tax=Flavobacterium sp. ALJ2 TaxID=2786960 RepID=UPI00189D3399|nr:NADAR family protein [Flavobacterium sp. ALJ2]MBF7091033.1 NADAR family protein [Flavobacterium sp. ALJ2]
MKYSIEKLIVENQDNKYLFFWGHQPNKDGSISKTCFSQWWLSSFEVDNVTYKTAEHWMMAKKAELFNDKEVLEKIIKANSPAEAKKLGREVKSYDDAVWLDNRYEIVRQGNFYKFSQNKNLKEFLINTKDRVLVEASPVDPIWGIGMASDHKDILNPEKWQGLNLLGFALMEVRDELK